MMNNNLIIQSKWMCGIPTQDRKGIPGLK